VKKFTVDNQVDQIAKSITVFPEVPRHVVNVGSITERQWTAKSISRHFVNHGSGKLILPIREQVSL
jgi:hypothetical protein